MRRVLVSVLFTAVFIPTVSASELIVEGDGLELITEYKITDDGYEEVYRNEELLKGEILNDDLTPFVLKGLSDGTEPFDVLIYLGNRFEIKTIIRGETDEACRFYPVGNEGIYIKDTGFYMGPLSSGFKIKRIYSLDKGLLFDIDSEGSIQVFPSGERFITREYRFRSNEYSDIYAYDVRDGLVYALSEARPRVYEAIDKDKDWSLFNDTSERDWYRGQEMIEGTWVIDEKGHCKFQLNAGSYCLKNYSAGRGKATYGSDNYICQIANLPENATVDEKGSTTVSYDTFLEVYSGRGNLLWDYELPNSCNVGRIFLSDNEEYLCLLLGRNEKLVVFKTAFGERVYELTDLFLGQLMEGGMISDDGNVIMVFSHYVSKWRSSSEDSESIMREFKLMVEAFKKPFNISIIKNRNVVGSVSALPEAGLINGFITPDGEYLIAGVPSTVCVYKIK
jgi:hypothetical protein